MKNLNSKFTTMKSILSILFLSFIFISNAQVPEEINYQMTIRDLDNKLITNKNIKVKISLIENSPKGEIVYTEIQNTKTNTFGLSNFKIGKGESLVGIFSELKWSEIDYFIEIGIDTEGNSNFSSLGAVKLVTVPYAFSGKDVVNKQKISIDGNIISLTDGGSITLPNTSNTTVSTKTTTTGNTLNEAYNEGGAGAGRTITADNGAVELMVLMVYLLLVLVY